jgi:hypothetical protein
MVQVHSGICSNEIINYSQSWLQLIFDRNTSEVEGNFEIVELYKIFNIFVQTEWTKLRKTTSLQFRQLYWILWETNMTYEG